MEKPISGSVTGGRSGFSWNTLSTPAKAGIVVVGILVGLLVATRILPALIAALGIGMLIALLFVPYWIPTIVAFVRNHPSKFAILMVNFFFGWTFVGWLISLVWALGSTTGNVQQVVVHTTNVMNTAVASPPPPQPRVGDVMNGHRFDGTSWVPLQPPAPPPPLVAQEYREGDVIEGRRFDGQSWVPVQPKLPEQVPPPEQTAG